MAWRPLLFFLLSAHLSADPKTVEIVRKLGVNQVTGAVVARPTDGLSAPIRKEFTCTAERICSVELDLPSDKSWQMMAEVPAHGSDSWVPVEKGSLEIWPSAALKGKALFPGETVPPEELRVRFHAEARDGKRNQKDGVDGETSCPLRDSQFECVIPAGVVDLSLRAHGFISVYRWRQETKPGAPLQVGAVELRKGASLVGQVISTSPDAPRAGACRVRLQPTANNPKLPPTASQLPETTVDGRGFFQLEVIPPGQWDLLVEQEGFAPARQAVVILERAEARLKSPVVLSRPVRFDVTLNPPQDPTGAPWRVSVLEEKGEARVEVVSESSATPGGQWFREGFRASGKYRLRVLTASGQSWWGDDEPFSPEGSPYSRSIVLDIETVEGTMTLGGRPLHARVVFGREHAVPSVSIEADQEGKLAGFLPRLGKWTVEVIGDSPAVRRKLEVEVRRKPDGIGEVSLALAGKAIQGDIVTEEGSPVGRAILYIANAASGEKSSRWIDGGRFQVEGLEPGDYVVSAAGGRLASSDVPVTLSKDGYADPVRLVMRKTGGVKIRVQSQTGAGLVGVPITIFTGSPGQLNFAKYTDTDGRATFETSPSSDYACFLVLAPGYAATIAGLPVTTEEQSLQVAQAGGSIALEYPPPSPSAYPMLGQGGCRLMPAMLAAFTRSANKNLFPNMAAGDYTLCLWSRVNGAELQGPCKSGSLAPYGSLKLAAEPSRGGR
jgi:hypothetical protein